MVQEEEKPSLKLFKKKKKNFINTQDVALSSLLCITGHALAPHLPIGNGPLSMMWGNTAHIIYLVWRQSDNWSVSNSPFFSHIRHASMNGIVNQTYLSNVSAGICRMDGWRSMETGEWIWVTLAVPWHFILCHQNVLSVNIFKHAVEWAQNIWQEQVQKASTLLAKDR